jgi:succinate dehydrogenase hydrophobic anchor subunit
MAAGTTASKAQDAATRDEQPSFVRRMWRDYNLSITVFAMFAVSFILHAVFGWWQYVADQTSQGQQATFWGWSGYVIYFGEWTFQNWQSEFLEVFVLIVLTAFLIHKGSHESKDGEDEMKAQLARIERRLDELAEEQR